MTEGGANRREGARERVGRVSAGGRQCERVGAQIGAANGRVGASRLRGVWVW